MKSNTNIENIPIVVLNWNGWDDSIKCIQSIYSAEDGALIWLVDNGSKENRSAELQLLFPRLRFVLLNNNYGWAVGNNKAIKLAKEEGFDFIYLINNDCIVDSLFLSSSLKEMDDKTASIGSQIVSYDGSEVIFDGSYMNAVKEVKETSGTKDVEFVNGAGMLISIDAFYKVGEFDARYFCYLEETEWCQRATKIDGYTIKINLASRVRHRREGSDISNNALYYRTRNYFVKTTVRFPYAPYLIDMTFDMVNIYRKENNDAQVNAMLCGLQDGLANKFGLRTSHKVHRIIKWQAYFYQVFILRFIIRAWYKVRGRLAR
jgi:GT2 family glycosyltransferase